MRLSLVLCCACAVHHAERKVEIITLESVSVYDLWLWENGGEEYYWEDVEPEPEPFGPLYYYPEESSSDAGSSR